MRDFLRLTRPINLLIIALTMVSMRHGLIGGYLGVSSEAMNEMSGGTAGIQLGHRFFELDFWLLVISTILIAAAGNVINDYFDTRIDRINKPGEVIVGRTVKRRVAMMAHLVMSGLGLMIGLAVAWHSGLLRWVLIPAFAIGSLWSYSTTFKRRLFIGNGLVALLTTLVPLTVGLYEIPLLQRHYAASTVITSASGQAVEAAFAFDPLWYWILAYSAFAFMATLARELQKDMADIEGDRAQGCRTVPIVLGVKWAKALTLFHLAVLILGVLFMRMHFLNDRLSFWYIGLGIVLPLLLSGGFTFNARSRREHLTAGNLMKLAMVMAVGYAWVVKYTL